MQTDETSRTPSRTRKRRAPFVALAVAIAAIGGACTTSGGGFDNALGGTVPLPPIVVPQTAQTGTVLLCDITFNSPGATIVGATATIPGINVNLGSGTITVPNIQLNLPSIPNNLGSIQTCLGGIDLGTIAFPATATATGVLNLATSQLSIDATITIPFTILGVSFPIVIPLSTIVVQL
jgi:hypothetical protein